jgi:hypothetical protein
MNKNKAQKHIRVTFKCWKKLKEKQIETGQTIGRIIEDLIIKK